MGPSRELNCNGVEIEAGVLAVCELAAIEAENSTQPRMDSGAVTSFARKLDAGETPDVGAERTTAPDLYQRNKAAAACAEVIQRGDCPLYELLAPKAGAQKLVVDRGNGGPGRAKLQIVR